MSRPWQFLSCPIRPPNPAQQSQKATWLLPGVRRWTLLPHNGVGNVIWGAGWKELMGIGFKAAEAVIGLFD